MHSVPGALPLAASARTISTPAAHGGRRCTAYPGPALAAAAAATPLAAFPVHLQAGSVAGIAGLSFASFVGISYLEVRRKIEEQLQAGRSVACKSGS